MSDQLPPTPPATVAATAAEPASNQTARQAGRYLQASIVGTLANFLSRFPLTELMGFEASVIVANYLGMGIVFLLSYRRAFGIEHPTAGMGARFVLVAHVGLATVWLVSTLSLTLLGGWLPAFAQAWLPQDWSTLGPWLPRLVEGFCHGLGIVAGFFVNFFGHRMFSFRQSQNADGGLLPAWIFALLIPLAYLVLYAPMGMDTTDFGFFYGHPWRILHGEVPFRDFYYTKPPASLYWHAFWMWLTPEPWRVLAGKAGFFFSILASSWLGALFLSRAFDLRRLAIPLPLLATAGFVFSAHSFPAMPWHTADGVLAGAACLWLAVAREGRSDWLAVVAGLVGAVALLTKQSFLFVPLAALVVMLALFPWRRAALFALGCGGGLLLFAATLAGVGAWSEFVRMTTGGLSTSEALEAGIGIYLHQNWWLPGAVLVLGLAAPVLWRCPWLATTSSHPLGRWRETLQGLLQQPFEVPLYFGLLTLWYGGTVLATRQWIGYGTSWPTLFVLLGGACVLLPGLLLRETARTTELPDSTCWRERLAARYKPSLFLGAALVLAWSSGISGGYKIPAFFSVPLLLAVALVHRRLGGRPATALWVALFCGLAMFRMGHEHPYVFPERPMPRSSLTHHAGEIFPGLQGVMVDAHMQGVLRDLKTLREQYGPRIKTLPGFSLASMLTGDAPVFPAEWLQDWEIAGDTDKIYQALVDRDLTVLFEKTQLDIVSPDGYARTRYTVPQRVRNEWRKVGETKHFVVFQRP